MLGSLSLSAGLFIKVGAAFVVLNEIRGLILAAPVMYGIYEAGGTLTAIWIGFCSLLGIAISVAVPILLARKLRTRQRVLSRNAAPQVHPRTRFSSEAKKLS